MSFTIEQFKQWVIESFPNNTARQIHESDFRDGLSKLAEFVFDTNSTAFVQQSLEQIQGITAIAGQTLTEVEQQRALVQALFGQTSTERQLAVDAKLATQVILTAMQQVATQSRIFQDGWNMVDNVPNLATKVLGLSDAGKFWKVSKTAANGSVTSITGIDVTANIGDEFTWNGTKWVWLPYKDANAIYLDKLLPSTVANAPVPRIVPSSAYAYNLYSGAGTGNYTRQMGWYFAKETENINQVGVFLFKDTAVGVLTGTAKVEVLHKRGSVVTILCNKQVPNAELIKCNTAGYSGNAANYEVKVNLNQTMQLLTGDQLFVALEVLGKFTHFTSTTNATLATGEWNTGSPAQCYRGGDQLTAAAPNYTDIPALPAGNSAYMPIHFYEATFTTDLLRIFTMEQEALSLKQRIINLETNPVSRKLPIAPSSSTVVTINGAQARIVTSSGYNYKGDPDTLMIICHGNGQNYNSMPSQAARDFLAAHNISLAIINTQDESVAPYSTNAVGWGNPITLRRNKELYAYCMDRYNFKSAVILAGQSMGGLAMGNLAYMNAFPILFCIGIGPVPSLRYMFTSDNYADQKRKAGIRAAYGMAAAANPITSGSVGADDANLDTFIQGYDWRSKSSMSIAGVEYKTFPSNLYIIAGNGDLTFSNDFGGTTEYMKLVNALKQAGVKVTYSEKAGAGHADASIWEDIISAGVFQKEMGIA